MEEIAWVSEACTLPTAEQPTRVAAFDEFFAEAVREMRQPEHTRLELVVDAAYAARARELAALETACCSFFAFEFGGSGAELIMSIEVPAGRAEVLAGLRRNLARILAERERP
ncbi:hypothetical protein [Nocardia sp. NPDC051832]|uniref:hypothetical protein n=1 Tax=Nocardia sp. NPDC051832 TaxID=3155673 RepID=UPI003433A8D9